MGRASEGIDRSRESFGLAGWAGRPATMGVAHCHNDVELNYVEEGAATYELGGAQVELRVGELCLFWAARPHQLRVGEAAPALAWVTLPLARFLSWRPPEALASAMLNGEPVICGRAAAELGMPLTMRRWVDDLAAGGAERAQIVCLELEALLRRVALGMGWGGARAARPAAGGGRAEQMARLIAARYAQPIGVAEVAADVGVHPHYAMQLFRAAYGMSVLEYLTRQRIAHAQMLLATTDMGVLEIGLASGFASASRFHSAFKAACGLTPGAYRGALGMIANDAK